LEFRTAYAYTRPTGGNLSISWSRQ
jgi:hypothetical protein